jgi:hypothetical protein
VITNLEYVCVCVRVCMDVEYHLTVIYFLPFNQRFSVSVVINHNEKEKLLDDDHLHYLYWFIIFLIVDRGGYECWDCKDR